MKLSKYRMAGIVMLAVGGLLLTVSGGYYAYAQFAKTGREDLVHQIPRPAFPNGYSPTYAENGTPNAVGRPQAAKNASASSTSEPPATINPDAPTPSQAILESEGLAADIEEMSSSGPTGTTHEIITASWMDHTPSVDDSATDPHRGAQVDMTAGIVDARIEAALEVLLSLQARRPGYVGYEPESQAVVEQVEPPEVTSRLVRVVPPSDDRNPRTSGQMIAELLESDFTRATPAIPEPQFATRMIVQGIGLRASVEELEVIEEGDSRAWETPKHVVGHIPTTAKPGTQGQGWYFGHLESPISGEGNVFRRLPELAVRFKRGEQFTIQLDAGSDRYVYQVYRTDVVHMNEFAVTNSGQNDITLVSCWPQYEYSERVLVTAALVDVVDIPESERTNSNSS